MSIAKKVFANSSVVTIGRIVEKTIGFFTTIILARYLGVELFGKYSLVLAFIAMFHFLADFGVGSYIIREISRNKEKANILLGNAFSLKIIFTIFAILVVNIAAFFAGYSSEILLLIFVFSFSMLSGTISALFNTIFQTELKMHYSLIVETIQGLLLLGIVLFFSVTNGSLFDIMVFYLASTFFVTFLAFVFARKFASFKPRFDFKLWKKLLTVSWPFALSIVFTIIYSRIDIVIISKIMDNAAVGMYSAVFRITESLTFIQYALLVSLYPVMSNQFNESKEALKRTTEIVLKFLVTLFVPISVGTFLLAQRLLLFFYGGDFLSQSSVQTMQILIFASLFIILNYLFINLLNSSNLEKSVLKIIFLGIIINVFLNLLLIPYFGIAGAAVATLIAEIAIFGTFYFIIKKELYKPSLRVFIKPFTSSILMAGFIQIFYNTNLFVLISLAGTLYFIVLFLLGGFSREDIELIKKVVRR